MKHLVLLPVIAALTCTAAAAQSAAAEAPSQTPEGDVAPLPQPGTARSVVEAQLRKAPRAEPRQQSRAEREKLVEQYLETIGTPIERRSASSARPR